MFNLGKKKPAQDAVSDSGIQHESRLFLYIGTMGYYARLVDGQGKPLGNPIHWDGTLIQEKEDSPQARANRMEKIIRQAISDLGRGPLRTADSIVLMYNSDRIIFAGNQHENLRAASDASARLFGQRLLNASTPQNVTFGFSNFEQCGHSSTSQDTPRSFDQETGESHGRSTGGVYAFAYVPFIRSHLSLFDQAGLKIIGLVPLPYLFLRKSTLNPTQTYCALHFGAFHTIIVVANCQINGLVVRYSSVGILSLAHAVSAKTGTAIKETLKNLGSRDLLPKPGVAGQESGLTQNPFHQGLEPGLNQLAQDIRETIDYFAGQRAGGEPNVIETFGLFEKVRGLPEWLSQIVRVDLKIGAPSVMDMLMQINASEECNLLRGAETSILAVGKARYSFSSSGFTRSEALASEMKGALHKSTGQPKHATGPGSRRRAATTDRRGEGSNPLALFTTLMAKLKPAQPGSEEAEESASDAHASAMQQGFLIFAGIIALILYGTYDLYHTYRVKFNRTVIGSYIEAQNQNKTSMKEAQSLKISLPGASTGPVVDKVFWTDKFVALSEAISEHIWINDMAISTVKQELAGGNVATKKLSIDGSVLPSADGHILRIAEFLAKLEDETKNEFKRDFRTIGFNGSTLDTSENIVHFNLDAWYDRNKRIEQDAKHDLPKDQGIMENLSNIKKVRDMSNDMAIHGAKGGGDK